MVDYIIVGAGTAGCVLANRLSENPDNQVLLIEAGGKDQKSEIHIPAAFSKLFKTKVDWAFYSTPQKHSNQRKYFLPRGKVVGGCSSINAMIYIRGHKLDYDYWEELGNKGWKYDEILPYFLKSEYQETIDSPYHGNDGPLHVTDLREPFPLTKAFVEAGVEIGYPGNPDFNGETQEGFGIYQVNQKDGKRHSAYRAFVKPILHRPNLNVMTDVMVNRVLIEGNVATGVEIQLPTHIQEINAAKEVILAAGAYQSPQLLMLSGIGPEDELAKHHIPVKHALRGVGKNLQDHLIVPLIFQSRGKHSLDRPENSQNFLKYFIWGEGPFSSNVAEGGGFVHTEEGLAAPDIQFHFGPAFFKNHGFDILKKGRGFSIGPTLLQPESIGEITLNSSNPEDAPLIDHHYLEAEKDLRILANGLKIAYQIANSQAMKAYKGDPLFPSTKMETEEDYYDYIRRNAQTLYHPIGTCKMGHDEDSVVNDELQVHGIKSLRIADASIMPKIVRGNTNAPVLMIAEKGAAMILGEDHHETEIEMSKVVSAT